MRRQLRPEMMAVELQPALRKATIEEKPGGRAAGAIQKVAAAGAIRTHEVSLAGALHGAEAALHTYSDGYIIVCARMGIDTVFMNVITFRTYIYIFITVI